MIYFWKALGMRISKTIVPSVWHANTQTQLRSKIPYLNMIALGEQFWKNWILGPLVSTLDFESTDPSSNLGGTFHFTAHQSEHTLLCQSCLTWYMVNLHLLVSVHWNLKCRSEMITSQWGDQKLWIRHDDEAKDLVLKPEWNQYTPQFGTYFENDPKQSSKCPCRCNEWSQTNNLSFNHFLDILVEMFLGLCD